MTGPASASGAPRQAGRNAPRAHPVYPLLRALAKLNSTAWFLQIGANEDSSRNPLPELIRSSRWRGVIADPIPEVAHSLRTSYGSLARVAVEEAAVAPEDGERPFYYDASPSVIGDTRAGGAPTGSLRREVLFLAPNYHPHLEDHLLEITVPCITLPTLQSRHQIEQFDVARIDTDGDEPELLEQIMRADHHPTVLGYSHRLLGVGVRRDLGERLGALGYQSLEHGEDTWCFSARSLTGPQAVVLGSVWRASRASRRPVGRLPGAGRLRAAARRALASQTANGAGPRIEFALTDEERRYLTTGHDERTPLPPGAATDLSRANPRLVELTARYAALDLPALRHHLWSESRVADNIDLRYFRGDNLYVWHYPEHPRAMALKMFVYARYLESRGGTELLELLGEDGAFGCWTTEIAGYGKVSRDLLDSVGEILFLDRQLGVRAATNLRILDIGAGYGRLAHRMSVAAPGLTDYCCVDAIAESTFLAEYYLSFRGCSPPARVVPLPEVEELEPGTFDLAVNVHSFSECTLDAVRWWVAQLERLRIPHLFVVPNEADGILSKEPDGSYHSLLPVFEAAGYIPIAKERAISDRATRELSLLNDNFYLFTRER